MITFGIYIFAFTTNSRFLPCYKKMKKWHFATVETKKIRKIAKYLPKNSG